MGTERGRPRTTVQQHRHNETNSAGQTYWRWSAASRPPRHSPLATAHANSDRAALPSSSHTTHGPFGFRFQVSRASAQRRCVVVGRSRSCVLTDKPILLRNHCLRATGISKRFPFVSAAMTISRHQSDADQVIPRTNNLFRLSWVLLIQLRSTARALLAVRKGLSSIHLRFALIYLTSSPSSVSRGFRRPCRQASTRSSTVRSRLRQAS